MRGPGRYHLIRWNVVPFTPYFDFGERILADLGAVGIRGKLQTLEGPGYRSKVSQGRKGFEGNHTIVHHITLLPGKAADYLRTYTICDGTASFICEPKVEQLWAQHEASRDLEERDRLSKAIQRYLIENYLVVPIYINAFVHAAGPNLVGNLHDYYHTKQAPLPWPFEEFAVKK